MNEPLQQKRATLSARTALAVLVLVACTQIGFGGPGSTDAAATTPVATTTSVSVSTTSVAYGGESSAVVTVTVTPQGSDPVTDGTTVPVTVGTGQVGAACTATLTTGSGTCTIPETALPAGGPYPITADFAGDASYGGSSGSAPTGLTVGQDSTATSLTANTTTVASGDESSVIFTIAVTTGLGEPVPDGETVQIGIDGLFCTAALTGGSGTCSIPDSALPGGQSYGVYAEFAGDTDLSGSFGFLADGLTVTGSIDYLLTGADGDVYPFGSAVAHGSLTTLHITPDAPVVGITTTVGDEGYRLVGADGGVFAFGSATFEGSLPGRGLAPAAPIVGMAPTSDGGGYWLVGADGGVFAFGDAVFHGSLPASRIPPSAPIVGIAPTADGAGYWLVGADGGVFAFGDAVFHGSAVGRGLAPVAGIVVSPDGGGYSVVDRDGGVAEFGDAVDSGSVPSSAVALDGPIVGVAAGTQGAGYWMVGSDGGVFAFGVPFAGSLESIHRAPGAPITGIATWVERPFSCSVALPHRTVGAC